MATGTNVVRPARPGLGLWLLIILIVLAFLAWYLAGPFIIPPPDDPCEEAWIGLNQFEAGYALGIDHARVLTLTAQESMWFETLKSARCVEKGFKIYPSNIGTVIIHP